MEHEPTVKTDETESVSARTETVLIASEVLDEVGMRASDIYSSLGALRSKTGPVAVFGAVPTTYYDNTEVVDRLEDHASAVLRLLHTVGAVLPITAPPSRETLEREARLRRDPRLWNEAMSRYKTALPHGIAPEPEHHDE